MSISLAGRENEHGEVTKEAFIESRKAIYFLFGAMHIKSKTPGSPLRFMDKSLGSPKPPCSEIRVKVVHKEFIKFPEHKTSALI